MHDKKSECNFFFLYLKVKKSFEVDIFGQLFVVMSDEQREKREPSSPNKKRNYFLLFSMLIFILTHLTLDLV